MSKKIKSEDGELNWFGEEVFLKVKDATDETVRAAAFQTLNYAKLNIRRNGQIDTSFMWNSGYVRTNRGESSYQQTQGSGERFSRKSGELVERERAPEQRLPNGVGALVAFGAIYAFWQELQQPFLYPALEQTQQDMGAIIERVKKQEEL